MESASETKQAYREKIESLLKEWEAKIEGLKVQAQRSKVEAKRDYLDWIEGMQRKRKFLAEQAGRLGSSSGAAWEDIKAGLDRGLHELKESIKLAAAHF